MSRIPTPGAIDSAPAGSRALLEAVRRQLGVVPNLFRVVANSPAALEGCLGMRGALSTRTNYVDDVAQTDTDVAVASARKAA